MKNFYRSWVEIDLEQFKKNVKNIKKYLPQNCEYLQILKADAYGHGAIQLGKIAEKELKIKYFGVANVKEGKILRDNGIKGNIIILSPSFIEEIDDIIKYNLTPSISDFNFALEFNKKVKKKYPIHIEIDTGMGRGGFIHNNSIKYIKKIAQLDNLELEGIFSHFPNSETINSYTENQIKIFKELIKTAQNENIYFKFYHIANSGGFLNYKESFFNMVRIGILSFGYFPGKKNKSIKVEPILSFKSKVALIKKYKIGKYISYGSTFETKRETKVAVIPVGYADGIIRQLSNKAHVIINGEKLPIIGNISMDMLMVDITDSLQEVKIGDEVVFLGKQLNNSINADEWAKIVGTINYEILTSIGKRAIRIYHTKEQEKNEKSYWENFFEFSYGNRKLWNFLHNEYGVELSSDLIEQIKINSLKKLFGETYNFFREDFLYKVQLNDYDKNYYKALIEIAFKKWANKSKIKIGVTNDENILQDWMKDKSFIYRWYLKKEHLILKDFTLKDIRIDNNKIDNFEIEKGENYIIFVMKKHLKVRNLFNYFMQFETFYSKEHHIFPVYFSDFTKNARLEFMIGKKNIRYFSFFTGKNLKIRESKKDGKITLYIAKNTYIFPQSGIIYYWR